MTNHNDLICDACGQPVTDNDELIDEIGFCGHVECLDERIKDAPWQAADFYFDAAGDR